jgi:hypothetical protein
MSISLSVIVIVFADLALVGGVGYLMSQARRLTPHRGANDEPRSTNLRSA